MRTQRLTAPMVLVALAAILGTGKALASDPGDPTGEAPKEITMISRSGGPTMTSNDGGRTWRIVNPEEDQAARRELGRRLQAVSMGAMISNTSVIADPNTGVASIQFTTSQPGEIVLTLHDARGVEVARVLEGKRSEGSYRTTFDTSTLTNGVYCFRIMNDGAIAGGGTMVIAH